MEAVQTRIGLAVGGIGAARLSTALACPAQTDTFLRLIRRCPLPTYPPPVIIGVDDWAVRKRHRYGSMIVDLERQQVIDLLPDRTPESVAAWLAAHPSIQMVSRDGAQCYADGVRQGAPTAIQIADRFHLMHNLAEVLRSVFLPHAAAIRAAVQPDPSVCVAAAIPQRFPVRPSDHALRMERRAQRLHQYTHVKTLAAQQLRHSAIAHRTGVSLRTVQRWVKTDVFPERQPRPPQPSQLDPYKPYLVERWNAGCTNGSQLYREIQQHGYGGKSATVLAYCVHLRQKTGIVGSQMPTDPAVLPSVTIHQAVWLVMRPEQRLTAEEQEQRQRIGTAHPAIATAITVAESFMTMVRTRQGTNLMHWIEQVRATDVQPFQRFAERLQRDSAAVEAGLTLQWSTGPVEGHINRLKVIKRQMDGRAKLDLLRRRLLLG